MSRLLLLAAIVPLALSPVARAADGPPAPHVAFVTSNYGGADLSDSADWPGNDGLTGLAAADAICRNHAWSAGLANWQGFRAWLSDSSNDAYCRVSGFDGTKTDNCGQPALPVAVGPWVRVDGKPWADVLELAVGSAGRVYRPLLTELGDEVPSFTLGTSEWSGTDRYGAAATGTCSDWSDTSTATSTKVGQADNVTTGNWGFEWTGGCNFERRLVCMETGVGPALPPEHSAGRLAFVTSIRGSGDLGSWPLLAGHPGAPTGLDAGDAICQTLAADAALPEPESFKAWLSTDTVDARDRFVHDGPWVRVDGVKLADDLVDLTDDGPPTGLTVDELGQYQNHRTETGTNSSGTATSNTCGNWADDTLGLTYGFAAGAHGWFAELPGNVGDCASPGWALYCLSDSPHEVLWFDGFESGDVAGWSASVSGS